MTGRILYHYNAQAMTGRTQEIDLIAGESFIEINTKDARKADVMDGEEIEVSSRRGTITTIARVSGKTRPGECWMPFHYLKGSANILTNDALDDISATPEYKVCAVKIAKLSKS